MSTILALCAHPDDAEILCGGTLLLLAKKGWNIHIATASCGDCGSNVETPNAIAIRRTNEAKAAAEKLGGEYTCLGGQDLLIYDDNDMRSRAVALIRKVQPDCVITHYPVDYMPDHTATSAVARMAVFTSPIVNYVTGPAAFVPPNKDIVPIYYCRPLGMTDWVGNPVVPHFSIDVTPVMDEKVELLSCHASQRDWLRAHHGIDMYTEQMKAWDAEAGEALGIKYAESFCIHKGHAYPQTPLIQDALREYCKEG